MRPLWSSSFSLSSVNSASRKRNRHVLPAARLGGRIVLPPPFLVLLRRNRVAPENNSERPPRRRRAILQLERRCMFADNVHDRLLECPRKPRPLLSRGEAHLAIERQRRDLLSPWREVHGPVHLLLHLCRQSQQVPCGKPVGHRSGIGRQLPEQLGRKHVGLRRRHVTLLVKSPLALPSRRQQQARSRHLLHVVIHLLPRQLQPMGDS